MTACSPRIGIVVLLVCALAAVPTALAQDDACDRNFSEAQKEIVGIRWSILEAKAMQIVLGASTDTSAPGRRAYLDFSVLVQRHFRPRMERLPIYSDAALKQIRMPVLAILGGKDVILDSAETKERLERAVPHATIRYLPDLGHGVLGEHASIFDFLTAEHAP